MLVAHVIKFFSALVSSVFINRYLYGGSESKMLYFYNLTCSVRQTQMSFCVPRCLYPKTHQIREPHRIVNEFEKKEEFITRSMTQK